MSAPAQPSAPVNPPIPRTRLQPVGGSGKSAYLAAVCLGLSILAAIVSGAYGKGGTLYINCHAPSALVQVDGNTAVTDPSGAVQIPRIPFGVRSVQVANRDYEPLSTKIVVGWLSANRVDLQLTPIPLTLAINTLPGAEVLLNNQNVGTANSQGQFIKSGVTPGDYDIQVRMAGFNTFTLERHLSPKYQQIYAGLSVSQERVRQIQEEQERARENAVRVQQLLATARQQFNSRQYQAALATVEDALKLDPNDAAGQQLKNRIQQTINILR